MYSVEAKDVLSTISEAVSTSTLQYLDVSDNALGLKGVRALSVMLSGARPTLNTVFFNNNGLEGRAARLISLLLTSEDHETAIAAVPAPSRDDTDAVLDEIIPSDSEADEDVGLKTNLTKFHTFNNLMESAGARGLSRLLRSSPSLTDVRVSSTRISSDGAFSLAKAMLNLQFLQKLDLSDNTFGPDGAAAIATDILAKQANLVHLNLAATAIEDDGAIAVCKALAESKCKLQFLDMSCNEITPNGADAIAELLEGVKGTLKTFKISENELGSSGIPILCSAFHKSEALETIDLSVNELTDAGAVVLAKVLPTLKELQKIELNVNLIGQAGLEAVHSALKDVDRFDALGEMDLNDDEYEEEEEDVDDERIAGALAKLHL